VAAFDVDGTLVGGDSLGPFLTRLLGRRNFARVLTGSGPAMVAAYRRAGRDAAKAELLVRAVAGVPVATAHQEGARYGQELARRVRPSMRQRLEWHRAQGHQLIVVSASLDLYLEPFGRSLGFDHVIATRLEAADGGHLTGHLLGPNVRGPEKAARLQEALGLDPVELWAYGDSAGDREMLAMADHALLVRRRPRRRASNPNPVEE
jgi:phosphatidylglycerophosphatase C